MNRTVFLSDLTSHSYGSRTPSAPLRKGTFSSWRSHPSFARRGIPCTETYPFREGSAMSIFNLKVNGRAHTVDVDPATPLLYVLSDDLELRGPKFGCGLGQCGSCAVM